MDPAHQYPAAGTYTVFLRVTDSDGDSANVTVIDYIQVIADVVPVASFIANQTTVFEGGWVQFWFDGDEGNAPASYFWEFGDGTNSTDMDPAHQYPAAGTYTVFLRVTDSDGDSANVTVIDYIQVNVLNTPPSIVFHDPVVEYAEGSVNNQFSFMTMDAETTSGPYTAWYIDGGYPWDTGIWWNSSMIQVNVDGLPVGVHMFNITVQDDMGYSDTVWVMVNVTMATDDGYEENDDVSSAAPVVEGAYMNLACFDDDWYAVVVGWGETLAVGVAFNHSAGNLDVELVGTDMSTILTWSNSTTSWEEVLLSNATVPGTYYVRVHGFMGAQNRYDMYIAISSPPQIYLYEGYSGNSTEMIYLQYTNGTVLGPFTNISIWDTPYGYWTIPQGIALTDLFPWIPNSTIICTGHVELNTELVLASDPGWLTVHMNPVFVLENGTMVNDIGILGINTSRSYTGFSLAFSMMMMGGVFMDIHPYLFLQRSPAGGGMYSYNPTMGVLKANLAVEGSLYIIYGMVFGNASVVNSTNIIIETIYSYGGNNITMNLIAMNNGLVMGQRMHNAYNTTDPNNPAGLSSSTMFMGIFSKPDAFPVANFTSNTTSTQAGNPVQFIFTGFEGDPGATFFWDFGDGTNSTLRDPIHVYPAAGSYTVSLVVTDSDGDNDTLAILDFVTVVPVSSFHPAFALLSNAELDAFCAGNGTDGLTWATAHVIENLIIDAMGVGAGFSQSCIELSTITRYVIIRNCTLYGATNFIGSGVFLDACMNVRIENCTIRGNVIGVYVFGNNGFHNILNNTIIDNQYYQVNIWEGAFHTTPHDIIVNWNYLAGGMAGLFIADCENITATSNIIQNNTWTSIYIENVTNGTCTGNQISNDAGSMGIYLLDATSIMLSGNIMVGCGIYVYGTQATMESYIVDTLNTVNGKPVYCYTGATTLSDSDFTNAGQVILISCANSSVSNLNVSNGTTGIQVYYSTNITVYNNDVNDNNFFGIIVGNSTHVHIIQNRLDANIEGGIYVVGSISCEITGNTISHHDATLLFPDSISIMLSFVNYSLVHGNTIEHGDIGVVMDFACNNTLNNNIVEFLGVYGIFLNNSFSNELSRNTFLNNTLHAFVESNDSNNWDDGNTGNYWDDYTLLYPIATNNNYTWSEPYVLNITSGNVDYFPLVHVPTVDVLPVASFMANQTVILEGESVQFWFA
nr:PKD domain-containing protein [Candidatus Sigynarchaeota archaeon]